MTIYTFRLSISGDEALAYYQGRIRSVSVMSEQGQRLQFPFHHLKPFISHLGIRGRFRLVLDDQNAITQIEVIGP